MRGDCTSRRTVFYNKDIFPNAKVVQNQKSPFVFFNDFSKGISIDLSYAEKYIDVESMKGSLKTYFIGQFERTIMEQSEADLLIVDNYADMNFELYESLENRGKLWVHKAYVRDFDVFNRDFKYLGRRDFEDSLRDFNEFSAIVRSKYGNLPIICLNQQVEIYPKLNDRKKYYDFGFEASKLIDGLHCGKILTEIDLELADVGSCGPGLTLHYQGSTYRKMIADIPILSVQDLPIMVDKEIIDEKESKLGEKIKEYDVLEISLKKDDEEAPYKRDDIFELFRNYFIIPDGDIYEPRFEPAIINISDAVKFSEWSKKVKKIVGDNGFRNAKKAESKGYFVEPFDRRTFIPDIYVINTSMPMRSGRIMGSQYTRTVEELGGYPTKNYDLKLPLNPRHWLMNFGVFLSVPGWSQGEVVTNKRLVGYIVVRRYGDLIFYPQVLGHGDHLQNGIMALLHFQIINFFGNNYSEYSVDAKYLMYTAMNTSPGLATWKRRVGFVGAKVLLRNY